MGMRLQKFLATYLTLLPEEEKGTFQLHLYLFLNKDPNNNYGAAFGMSCEGLPERKKK